MKNIVLMGGGLDTTFVLAYGFHTLAMKPDDTMGLFVDYGQRAMAAEQSACKRLCQHYGIKLRTVHQPEISRLFPENVVVDAESPILLDPEAAGVAPASDPSDVQTYVPARNIILTSIATALAMSEGATDLWVGFDGGDGSDEIGYPDTTRSFTMAMSLAIRAGTRRSITINDPVNSLRIRDVTTARMIQIGSTIKAPWHLSMSCLQGFVSDSDGSLVHCNGCGNCARRSYGFMSARISDPTVYWNSDPGQYGSRVLFE